MPGLSAREMLSKLPLRMANGGPINLAQESALDQSRAYKNALESGGLEGVQAYYANLRGLADKYMAGTLFEGDQPIGVDAYNEMLKAGISNTDLINAGVGQDVLDKIFTTATANPAFDAPAPVESAFMTNPALAAEAAARSATGVDGVASIQKQGREFVANIQQDGVTPEEQRLLRELALEGGFTTQDILAAGVDPSILFNVPTPTPDPIPPKPAPTTPPPDPFPQTQAPYVAPEVYQPIEPQPDIFAAGQPALDEAFRASPPRTEVTEPIFGEDQLVGFDYLPAAQLLSATGSGFSFTPPSVTSRPRTLMSTNQLNRFNRGRAAQDLRQILGPNQTMFFPDATGQMQQTTTYDRLKPLLDRTGSYGGGLSRSQLFNLVRQQNAQDQATLAAMQPKLGGAQGARRTGSIQDYIALNPDVAADFQTQVDEGRLSSDMTLEQFATNHYNNFGLREMAAGTRAPFSLTSGFTGATGGVNAPLQTRDLRDTTMGSRFFAEGGLAKKPEGYANGGSVPETDFDALQRQLEELDKIDQQSQPPVQAPSDTDQEARTESRGMLDRLNQGLFEKVTKPVLGSALDMTVGLGDLAQLGIKKGAEALGMDPKPFVPVSQRLQESAGVEGYDPYSPAAIATQILPFARARQAGTVAATELGRLFPSLGRETAAFGGSELAAAGAREVFPDSTAAELLASVAGGVSGDIGGTAAIRRMADDVPPPPIDTESSRLLDDIEQAAAPAPAKLSRAENSVINEKVGTGRKVRQEAKAEARRIKENFDPAEGWAPIEVSNVKKDKAGAPKKIEFKKIPYGYQNPPEGINVETYKSQLADGIVREVDDVVRRAEQGDVAALDILAQANWYRGMRDQLRSEFGGIGDVFADILGTTSAQTNVEQNFKNAMEILRRYSRGEYDNELAAYQRRIDQGLPVDGKTLTRLHKEGEFPLITKAGGELFNTNSPSSMGALLDMFRSVKTGSSPKTPNFTGNLIGLTNEATVDVWAARMLRRLSDRPRIPPAAEQGVSGTHLVGSTLFEPRVGGEFGFGQDVFRDAARRVNESGRVRDVSPELGDLGPDDLQAVAWFIEKERWTKNGWTTKAGEGGSLEYEMSLAGAPDQNTVDSLRRAINQGFKTPAKRKKETDDEYQARVAVARSTFEENRDQMQAELSIMEAPLQRYQLGISGERPNQPMSNYAQAELAAPIDDAVRNDQSVATYNIANAYGSFMGDTERALNAEFVVRQDFNPERLRNSLVQQGKEYDQDAVFMSRVVPSGTPNARPGVEIYFKESVTPAQMAAVTQRLREKGVDGFTYVTDMRFDDRINRQTRSGDPETAALTGLRFQYIPEFDDAFDPARSSEIYAEQEDLFRDVVADTIADGGVSDARLTFYDTEVYFRDDYDEYLTRSASKRNPEARGELATGADDPQSNRSGEGRPEPPESVSNRGSQAATPKVTATNKKGEPLGINIAVDRNGTDYADLIIKGTKKFESRETPSLKPYVGKRVGIVRTGAGPAEVIGTVEIGKPIEVNENEFARLRDQHLVSEDSSFNIKKGQTKFLYPMIDPVAINAQKVTSRGIVARTLPDMPSQAATNKRGKVTFEAFGGSLADARQKLGITTEQVEEFKNANKGVKQTRVPEVQDAAKKLKAGEITTQDYLQTVEKFQPITPLNTVEKRPTNEQIAMALAKKNNGVNSGGIVGVNIDVPDGTMISSRLDIPAYESNDTWVVTLHDGTIKDGLAVGYGQTAVLNGVEFTSNPKAALNMAAGGNKGTIARINGSWENHDSAAIEKLAQDILDGTAPDADQWTEVGMNPFRHSYFYRKSDGMPVANAEQVIQIGPLVLAKKVETRPVESPEHEIKTPKGTQYFKGGGDVDRKDDNRIYI